MNWNLNTYAGSSLASDIGGASRSSLPEVVKVGRTGPVLRTAQSILLLFLLAIFLVPSTRADEQITTGPRNSFEVGAQVDFLSQYTFRSFVYTDGAVMQPYIFTSYRGVNFDISTNMNLEGDDEDQGKLNEYQFDLYTVFEWKGILVEPAATYYYYYYYPDFAGYDSTGELGITLYRNIGDYTVSLHNSMDVLEFDRYYYASLGLGRSFRTGERFSIDASLSVDYSQDPQDVGDAFVSGMLELTGNLKLSDSVYLRPYVGYSEFIATDFIEDDDSLFTYGIGVSAEF